MRATTMASPYYLGRPGDQAYKALTKAIQSRMRYSLKTGESFWVHAPRWVQRPAGSHDTQRSSRLPDRSARVIREGASPGALSF